jgi:hypothetical protein
MDTQIERRRRALTDQDIVALVDAMERRAIDRIERSLGHSLVTLVVTWSVRVAVMLLVYAAGANGVLKRLI